MRPNPFPFLRSMAGLLLLALAVTFAAWLALAGFPGPAPSPGWVPPLGVMLPLGCTAVALLACAGFLRPLSGLLLFAFFALLLLAFFALPGLALAADPDIVQASLDHWEAIFAVIGAILTTISPVAALFWQNRRRAVRELVEVISTSRTHNTSFRDTAKQAGLRVAEVELEKLIARDGPRGK